MPIFLLENHRDGRLHIVYKTGSGVVATHPQYEKDEHMGFLACNFIEHNYFLKPNANATIDAAIAIAVVEFALLMTDKHVCI